MRRVVSWWRGAAASFGVAGLTTFRPGEHRVAVTTGWTAAGAIVLRRRPLKVRAA